MIPFGVLEKLTIRERGRVVCVCRGWRTEAENPSHWPVLDCRAVMAASVDAEAGRATLRRLLRSPRFSSLEAINLECCKPVGDAELELLHDTAATLQRVNLNALHSASPEAITALVGRCVKCISLELYWHPRLTDAVLVACSNAMGSTLRDLNLAGCGTITDAGITRLMSKCTHIEKLNITRCPKLTDEALQRIAEAVGKNIKDLIAYADSAFSDVGYGHLANSGLPRLERLDTCGARLLTSAALATLVRRCGTTLSYLNCSWCVALDDRAGLAVAKACRVLKLLSFHGIMGITDLSINALAESPVATTLTTLDINGCARVTDFRRDTPRISKMFPFVTTWIHHR